MLFSARRVLFETSKRLSKVDKELDLHYREAKINITTSYKCLGTYLDSTLSLNDNFETCTGNLLVGYSYYVNYEKTLPKTQLESLQQRASTIISNNTKKDESLINTRV